MGLFNDYRGTNREGWKYTYKGGELLEAAKRKWAELRQKEMDARNNVAAMLKDEKVSPNDDRLEEGKRLIEKYGNEREQCMVFCHEFARAADRDFTLGLGDVTYFDLAPQTPVGMEK